MVRIAAIKIPVSIILATVAAGSLNAQAGGRNPAGPPGLAEMERFTGRWDMISFDKQPDGRTTQTHSTSHSYWILDGFAVQDDFRALNQAGQVIFRGTSIRTYDPRSGEWVIRWLMVGDPGMTDIRARFENGRLVGRGVGTDMRGEFLERFTYTFPDPDHYIFEMDRSYDNGASWIEDFNRIEATRLH